MAQNKYLSLGGLEYFKDKIISIIQENELTTAAALNDLNNIKYDITSLRSVINENIQPASAREYEINEDTYSDSHYQAKTFCNTIYGSRSDKIFVLGDITKKQNNGILTTGTQSIAGKKIFKDGITIGASFNTCGDAIYDFISNINFSTGINNDNTSAISYYPKNFYANCSNGNYASVGSLVLEIKNNNNFIKLYNKNYSGEIYNTNTFLENITNIQSLINNVNESIFSRIDNDQITGFCSDIPIYLGDIYNSGTYEIFKDSFSLNTDIEISGPIKLIGTDSNGILFYSKNITEDELINYDYQGNNCGQEYTKEELKERNKIYLNENIYDLIPGYIAYTDSDLENLSIYSGYNKGIKLLSNTRILADLYLNESAESVQSIISGIKTTNTNQDTKISNIEQILQTFIESFGISLEGTGTLLEKLNSALQNNNTSLQNEINKHAKDASKHLPTLPTSNDYMYSLAWRKDFGLIWAQSPLITSINTANKVLVSTNDYKLTAWKTIDSLVPNASGNYIYNDKLASKTAKSGLVTTDLQSFSGEKQFLDGISILPAFNSAWYTDTPDIESVSALYFSPDKNNFIKWSYLSANEEDLTISGYRLNITGDYGTLIKSEIDNVEISGANIFIESGDTGSVEISSKSTTYNDSSIWVGEGAINIDAPSGLYINGEMYSGGGGSSISESVLKLYEDPFSLDNDSWTGGGLSTDACEDNRGSFIQTPIALKRNSTGDCGILFDNGIKGTCESFLNYIGLSETAIPNSTYAKSKTDTLIINSEVFNNITTDPHSKIITNNNIYNNCKMFIPRASNITSYSYTNYNNFELRYRATKNTYGEDFYLNDVNAVQHLIVNGQSPYLSTYLNKDYHYYIPFKITMTDEILDCFYSQSSGNFRCDCCGDARYSIDQYRFDDRDGYVYNDELTWSDIGNDPSAYGLVLVVYIVENSSYTLENCKAYKGIYLDFTNLVYGIDTVYKDIIYFISDANKTHYIKACILTGRQYIYFKTYKSIITTTYRLGFSFSGTCSECWSDDSLYYGSTVNSTVVLPITLSLNNFSTMYYPRVLTYDFPPYLKYTEQDVFTLQDNGILSYCNYSNGNISSDNANLNKTNIYKIDNAEFLYKPLNLTYPGTATIFNISERNLLFTNLKLNDSLNANEVYSWFNVDECSIYMGVNNLNSGFNYSSLKLINSVIELSSQTAADKRSSKFSMNNNMITQGVHRTGNYNTYSILTDTAFYLISTSYHNGPLNSTGSLYTTKVNIGSSSYRVGTVYASAALNTSDERFKEHQSDIDIDFDKLKSIPKFIFKWKDSFLKDDDDLHIGTSAQAIRDVYPEIVHVYNSDVELCAPRDIYDPDAVLAIEYDKLGVIALAAIDKLHEENVQLKEENEQLKTRLDNLEQLLKDKGII
jgi:hypothetical protein